MTRSDGNDGEPLAGLLECPECHRGAPDRTRDSLVCPSCNAVFPVIDNIPRLLPAALLPRWVGRYAEVYAAAPAARRRHMPVPEPAAGTGTFAGVGGRDYHETRRQVATVRYSLQRRARALSETLARLGASGADVLLEVGCADGLLARLLVGDFEPARVVGIDLQEDQLPHNPYAVCQGDCRNMPFAGDSFDCVVAAALIEHLPDPPAFVREAFRVLKPGGVIALTCPDPAWDRICTVTGYFKYAGHLHRLSIDRVTTMLRNAGFARPGGRKFMLTPVKLAPVEWLETSPLGTLFRPLMVNQVIWGRKPGKTLFHEPTAP